MDKMPTIGDAPAPPPQIFVAVPSGRSLITGQTTSTLVTLTRVLVGHNMMGGFGQLSFPDVAEVRNIFLTIWYDAVKSSHILFIDDDMAFDPQLVLDMVAMDKPLVGALCPKRKLPIEFAGRAKAGECRIVNGFMEVDGIGGAIMLIRRDCIDAMIAKYPDIIDTVTVKNHAAREILAHHKIERLIRSFDHLFIEGEKFSEDLSFCLRHKQASPEPIWANITHAVTHVGAHEFTGCYFDQIKEHVTPVEPLRAVG